MRVILILLMISVITLILGYRIRKQDRMASNLLFVFSAFSAAGLIGSFFDLF